MQPRYFATYLSWEIAKKMIRAAGQDPDYASIWDHCDQSDIEVGRKFTTKDAALAWAKANAALDIFNMPRIVEETYAPATDDRGRPAGFAWERTGFWEIDCSGDVTEIEQEWAA